MQRPYAGIVNVSLASAARPRRHLAASAAIDDETVPQAAAFRGRAERRCDDRFHVLSNMTQHAEFELDDRTRANPVGDFDRTQGADRPNAAETAMRQRQDDQLEIDLRAIFGTAGHASD